MYTHINGDIYAGLRSSNVKRTRNTVPRYSPVIRLIMHSNRTLFLLIKVHFPVASRSIDSFELNVNSKTASCPVNFRPKGSILGVLLEVVRSVIRKTPCS